jgi:hypothetical protein
VSASAISYKRKSLFFIILFIAASAFTADILDLREDVHILSVPYSSLDSNITTAVISAITIALETIITSCPLQQKTSVEISFIHLLPYGFRAPPTWS